MHTGYQPSNCTRRRDAEQLRTPCLLISVGQGRCIWFPFLVCYTDCMHSCPCEETTSCCLSAWVAVLTGVDARPQPNRRGRRHCAAKCCSGRFHLLRQHVVGHYMADDIDEPRPDVLAAPTLSTTTWSFDINEADGVTTSSFCSLTSLHVVRRSFEFYSHYVTGTLLSLEKNNYSFLLRNFLSRHVRFLFREKFYYYFFLGRNCF